MRLAEEKKIVPLLNTEDYVAGVSADSINMKGFHRCTFICTFGTIAGDALLTVASGATDGTADSALTFHYAWATADTGTYTNATTAADILAADATSASLTVTGTAYDDRMLIVEVDASDMDIANGENWLTLSLSNAASEGVLHIVAILEPRYTGNISGSALA
jgi:hypothetical protein